MSTEVTILAIGPFSPAVKEHLEYSPSLYDRVAAGATVFSEFIIATTAEKARDVANTLGVDMGDASTHADIYLSEERIERLSETARQCGILGVSDSLRALMKGGFRFFYRVS